MPRGIHGVLSGRSTGISRSSAEASLRHRNPRRPQLAGGFGLGCGDGLRAGPGGFFCSFGWRGLRGFFASDGSGQAEVLAQSGVVFVANVDIFAQEKSRALASLGKGFAAERNPRVVFFFDDTADAE